MVPAGRRDAVEPIQTEINGGLGYAKSFRRGEPKIILPVEETQVDAVALAYPPIDLPVEVVEEIAGVGGDVRVLLVDGSDDRVDNQVDVRAASTQHERGLVFNNGAFYHEFRSEDGDVRRAVNLLHVPILHVHLKHRREPPAKTRGESALGDGHLLDGIGVEHREETKQVADAVQRYPVEDDEVLVGAATAHIQARRALAARLYPRHELEALQQVDFATDGRQPAHLIHGDFHFGHLHLVFDTVESFSGDDGLIDGDACTQFKIQFEVLA